MNKTRESLHDVLLNTIGTTSVYFQPPPSISMKYPAIVYKLSKIQSKYASDSRYNTTREYQVTIIDKSPISPIVDRLLQNIVTCEHTSHFCSDNLNHDVFNVSW